MRFLDTFSGIGGFHLSIKTVLPEASCVGSIEFNKDSVLTYKNNFNIDSLGDITKINTFPEHDFLMGGFPCQPFSSCGKWGRSADRQIGEGEDRDNLFVHLIRILEQQRPKYFLFENVKGMLTIKNKDGSSAFDTITEAFRQTGYDLHVKVLDSADFGLPQQRKRLFFAGFRDGKSNFQFPHPETRTTAVKDILDSTTDDKYLIKNVWKNRQCNLLGGSRYEKLVELYNSNKWIKPEQYTHKITPVAIIENDTPSGLSRQHDRLYSHLGISTTILTFAHGGFDVPSGWRLLTPRETARCQGFPESIILPKNDTLAYKQVGNAVAVPVVTKIISKMLED